MSKITKEILDKEGTKILELDRYDSSIYLGTYTLYLYQNKVYEHEYNCNKTRYTGKEYVIYCWGTREEYFSKMSGFKKEHLVENIENILTEDEIKCFRN